MRRYHPDHPVVMFVMAKVGSICGRFDRYDPSNIKRIKAIVRD